MARSHARDITVSSACDGKRAGDTCTVDGGIGIGTCVPDCDAQCLSCVAAVPAKPDTNVVAGGGCGGGLALMLVLVLVLVIFR